MHREASLAPEPRRALRRWGVVALVGALAIGAVAGPAGAQEDPPAPKPKPSGAGRVVGSGPVEDDPPKTDEERAAAEKAVLETLAAAPEDQPASPDDPFEEVVTTADEEAELRLVRVEATARANDANQQAFAAAEALQDAKELEVLATAVRNDADAELATERDRMSDLTVRAYVSGGRGDLEQFRALASGDTTDPESGRVLLFSQVLELQEEVTKDARAALKKAQAELEAVREIVAAAEAKTARLASIAADRTTKRVVAEREHDASIQAANEAKVRLRTAANGPVVPVSQDVAIIGMPRLTGEDLAGWFATKGYKPKAATPIEHFAYWFIEEGKAEGIRGDIAFAQAVLETGGFTNTDSVLGHNFSGIGHYDNLARGWTFASPRSGVRAQIQLLKSYAFKDPPYANPLIDKRLRGPSGCCQTWGELTSVWATSPIYGDAVMMLYTSLVDYALQRRANGEGDDDPLTLAEAQERQLAPPTLEP